MTHHKSTKSWTLPIGIIIVSWGNIGWTIRINLWKYTIETKLHRWPSKEPLLSCYHGLHYLLPCIVRNIGGIYGTPHDDFHFNSLEICWWYFRWKLFDH